MKIYTKSGDRGKTSLFSGERVDKYHSRVEAYGDVDELNSVLGLLITALHASQSDQRSQLETIQSDLFQIGAWMATSADAPLPDTIRDVSDARIAFLEAAIDGMQAVLPELRGFIMPGGHPGACHAHVARTVCRRAERHTVAIPDDDAPGGSPQRLENTIAYLNRLSDYLFVLARHCNHSAGEKEILWKA